MLPKNFAHYFLLTKRATRNQKLLTARKAHVPWHETTERATSRNFNGPNTTETKFSHVDLPWHEALQETRQKAHILVTQ